MSGPVDPTRVRRPGTAASRRAGLRTPLILAAALAVVATLPQAARAQHGGGGGGWHGGGGGGWHGGGGGGWHGGGGGWHGGGWHGGGWWWGPAIGAGVFAGAALGDPYGYGYPYADGYPYGFDDPSAYNYPPNPYGAPGYTATAPSASYCYYCQNPAGYYPYVQRCGTQWQPVPMQPPG
jgi:hypothetical protein